MASNTVVWITSQFEALHQWKNAPEDVAFLRYPHRHLFKVKVHIGVSHRDRDVEFFQARRKLQEILAPFTLDAGAMPYSCENYASAILDEMRKVYTSTFQVEVSEDGENGAVVTTL